MQIDFSTCKYIEIVQNYNSYLTSMVVKVKCKISATIYVHSGLEGLTASDSCNNDEEEGSQPQPIC